MKKNKLKRLLDYCPKPSTQLIRTLKRYSIPTSILISATIVIASLFLLFPGAQTQPPPPPAPTQTPTPTPPAPTQTPAENSALEKNYLPGVSVGDYVTYGNFKLTNTSASGPEKEWISSLGDVDWQRVEVIEVSGKGVTLLFTEQLKNGSLSEHSGCVHVIDDVGFALDMDGSCQFKMYYFRTIIPANLTKGDSVYPPPGGPPPYDITKTEVRTYFGVNREVNILESPVEEEMPYDTRAVYEVGGGVFDRLSGMLLEYNTIMPNGERLSYSIIETNIF